ncbi:MAG: hypothetical protein IAB19_02995 [Proteobacteria bacterium]|uniref:Uncharacterized protein n=1 Tax=Candidatus Avisuccinivibrio stercorigallinarum TaxID=2840704 RepID=A0A9D9D901_9GAMM|nr:hypothetical protein [Candidatus Avisuccinivibrio stercorigallinarum]
MGSAKKKARRAARAAGAAADLLDMLQNMPNLQPEKKPKLSPAELAAEAEAAAAQIRSFTDLPESKYDAEYFMNEYLEYSGTRLSAEAAACYTTLKGLMDKKFQDIFLGSGRLSELSAAELMTFAVVDRCIGLHGEIYRADDEDQAKLQKLRALLQQFQYLSDYLLRSEICGVDMDLYDEHAELRRVTFRELDGYSLDLGAVLFYQVRALYDEHEDALPLNLAELNAIAEKLAADFAAMHISSTEPDLSEQLSIAALILDYDEQFKELAAALKEQETALGRSLRRA